MSEHCLVVFLSEQNKDVEEEAAAVVMGEKVLSNLTKELPCRYVRHCCPFHGPYNSAPPSLFAVQLQVRCGINITWRGFELQSCTCSMWINNQGQSCCLVCFLEDSWLDPGHFLREPLFLLDGDPFHPGTLWAGLQGCEAVPLMRGAASDWLELGWDLPSRMDSLAVAPAAS